MPSIVVVPDTDAHQNRAFHFKERVTAPLLDDPHFVAQLIERLAWAVGDAAVLAGGRHEVQAEAVRDASRQRSHLDLNSAAFATPSSQSSRALDRASRAVTGSPAPGPHR